MINDIFNKLHITGDLTKLIFSGAFKNGFLKKREVYLFFNKEWLISGDKGASITYTAEKLNVSESYVYKAIQLMESEGVTMNDADYKPEF